MEALLAILALVGGLLAFRFKRKSDQKAADSLLAETAAKDKELTLTQKELEIAIAEIDASLAKLHAEQSNKQKKEQEDALTLSERRNRIIRNFKLKQ